MLSTKKRILLLEKKIADLEGRVQSQQEKINLLIHQGRPLGQLDEVVQSVLQDSGTLTFQVNLGNRVLFEQKPDQNS